MPKIDNHKGHRRQHNAQPDQMHRNQCIGLGQSEAVDAQKSESRQGHILNLGRAKDEQCCTDDRCQQLVKHMDSERMERFSAVYFDVSVLLCLRI